MRKKMCVVGLGYIGLPTAVMFANNGFDVLGVDINESVVERLRRKELTIKEPGLFEQLSSAIDSGRLRFALSPQPADTFMLAVPTPIREDKTANLEYVKDAARSIVPYLRKGNLVVLESTVPPRTVEDVLLPILKEANLSIGDELFVAHSPERVIPGRLFTELVNNDRIVGGINERSSELAIKLYREFVKGTIHVTDATTAEFVKVIENTYRDVNIAFANELAQIAEKIGVNIWEAIELANCHPRVNVHTPGPGVGGHCIAVDPWFIVEQAPELARLIRLSRQINDGMPNVVVERMKFLIDSLELSDPKIAVWGLAFKGNIDDMRGTPSTDVIRGLELNRYRYTVYDPFIQETRVQHQVHSVEESVTGADIILVLTNHSCYRQVDITEIKNRMSHHYIMDTRNLLSRKEWEQAGFTFFQLGDGSYGDMRHSTFSEVAITG